MSTIDDIKAVLDLYTYIVDASDWDRMSEVVTRDVAFSVRGTPVSVRGVGEVVEILQRGASKPLMHLTTNLLIDLAPDGRSATATSKVLTPKRDGTAGLAKYDDVLVLTDAGWRISKHTVDPSPGSWRISGGVN